MRRSGVYIPTSLLPTDDDRVAFLGHLHRLNDDGLQVDTTAIVGRVGTAKTTHATTFAHFARAKHSARVVECVRAGSFAEAAHAIDPARRLHVILLEDEPTGLSRGDLRAAIKDFATLRQAMHELEVAGGHRVHFLITSQTMRMAAGLTSGVIVHTSAITSERNLATQEWATRARALHPESADLAADLLWMYLEAATENWAKGQDMTLLEHPVVSMPGRRAFVLPVKPNRQEVFRRATRVGAT